MRADGDLLDRYVADVRRQPRLTRAEEADVAIRARAGDPDARDLLVRANLLFVMSVARQYDRRGVPVTDLISEGNLGLLRAADRFDPSLGIRFISYAVWSIRAAIQRAVGSDRTIRIPRKHSGMARDVRRAGELLWQKLRRPATAEEIAEVVELPIQTVRGLLLVQRPILSLDAPVGEDGDLTRGDLVPDGVTTGEDLLIDQEQTDRITNALDTLPPREARIVRLYFGIGGAGRSHTLDEIGAALGVTRERVRQLRDRALARLRKQSDLGAA